MGFIGEDCQTKRLYVSDVEGTRIRARVGNYTGTYVANREPNTTSQAVSTQSAFIAVPELYGK